MSAMSSGVPVWPNGIILWRAVVSASKSAAQYSAGRYGVHAIRRLQGRVQVLLRSSFGRLLLRCNAVSCAACGRAVTCK